MFWRLCKHYFKRAKKSVSISFHHNDQKKFKETGLVFTKILLNLSRSLFWCASFWKLRYPYLKSDRDWEQKFYSTETWGQSCWFKAWRKLLQVWNFWDELWRKKSLHKLPLSRIFRNFEVARSYLVGDIGESESVGFCGVRKSDSKFI